MTVDPQQILSTSVHVNCQKLLERIPRLAWLMSDRGEILISNKLWSEYIGRSSAADGCSPVSSEDLRATTICTCTQTFADILHQTERDRFAGVWATAIRRQEPLEIKLRLGSSVSDGEWFQVELEPDRDRSGATTWIGTAISLGGAGAISNQQSTQFIHSTLDGKPIEVDLTVIKCTGIIADDLSQLDRAESDRTRTEHYSERLATALQVGKAGAWYWELEDNKLCWTREFEILFDYEPGSTQKTYSEWSERIHPDDRQRVENLATETIAGRLPQHRCEYRIVCRDGQIRWLDGIGEIGTDERGKVYLSGLVCDITERKRNEEALRRSEEFQRRILESNHDCIKVFDLAGRLLYMNHGGLAKLEIDNFKQIANKPWIELWQGHKAEDIERVLDLAKEGKRGQFEGFCPTAKGKPKWWEVIVTPILDADGRVDRILGVSRDITDRRNALSALQASEELFRNTFDYTPLGFAHVAPNGLLLRVNRKFCEIVGYSSAELLKLTFHDMTEPADLAEDVALVDRLLQGEIQEYTLEKRYIHKQGHHVWVSLTVSLVREIAPEGQLGVPNYFLSAVQDISRRKQLELTNQEQTAELQHLNSSLLLAQHQLKDRNEELDSFVRIASHDLKAPLRAIANLAQWLEDDIVDRLSVDERQQFELLRQRVHRMSALIDGLLRYSRLGREELATETVDVSELVAETIDSIDPPASFEIEIVSPLPTLDTKRLLLSQVFANLINNAIKHHQRVDGRIEIGAKDCGDCYQFSIADNGPGIPVGEARDRIFEIFQTLKPSHSTENTGIGLAVVKKIVEGEGGRIWLDSDRVTGACFCFTWLKAVK